MADKMLVPVDGSQPSDTSLRYACKLASKLGASITAVHIVIFPSLPHAASFDCEPLLKEGKTVLRNARKIAEQENFKDIQFELKEGVSNAGHAIVTFVKEEGFSLVVMGSGGHTTLTHPFLGSVSETVVHQASCPVLIVK